MDYRGGSGGELVFALNPQRLQQESEFSMSFLHD